MMTQQPEAVMEQVAETQNAVEAAKESEAPSAVACETPVACETTAAVETVVVEETPAPAAVEPTPAPVAVEPTPAPVAVEPTPVPAAVEPTPAPAAEVKPAAPAAKPMALAAAQAHTARKATKSESSSGFQPTPQAQRPRQQAPEQLPYVGQRNVQQLPTPKYDTYSKSEVDHMMKQQADSILQALSGKVASQQRAFQEAIAAQEKAFNKLSDNFISQYDNARVKLESTTKNSEANTKALLDDFHKQLTKELEEYRKQVSKTVAKVAEGGSKQQQQQPAKQQNIAPKAQAQITAAQAKLQNLIVLTLAVSAVSVVLSLVNLVSHAH